MEKRRQERVRLEDLGELVSVERLRHVFDPPLGRSLAYELAHQLNPVRIGRRVFVRRVDVERLLRGERSA